MRNRGFERRAERDRRAGCDTPWGHPKMRGGHSTLRFAGAHHVRDVGVAGSNPATPTNTYLIILAAPPHLAPHLVSFAWLAAVFSTQANGSEVRADHALTDVARL